MEDNENQSDQESKELKLVQSDPKPEAKPEAKPEEKPEEEETQKKV